MHLVCMQNPVHIPQQVKSCPQSARQQFLLCTAEVDSFAPIHAEFRSLADTCKQKCIHQDITVTEGWLHKGSVQTVNGCCLIPGDVFMLGDLDPKVRTLGRFFSRFQFSMIVYVLQ